MALYVTASELENALTENIFFEIFNDGTGVINADAINQILSRASHRVDGYLAKQWKGPFPMPDPVPKLAKEAALLFAMWMSWRRAPEVAKRVGRSVDAVSELTEAKELCDQLKDNTQRPPDLPKPGNVGARVGFGSRCSKDGVGGGFWGKGFGGF
jgi:hypothetical protein